MTVARSLAEFLTQVSYADLPPQTVEHAAMLIASTIASAAWGSGIASSAIIRDLAREHGGTPEASVWFDPGPKLPVAEAARVNAVMSAAASDDSDLRNIVHAGTTLAHLARHGGAHRCQRPGRAGRHCSGLRGVGAHWRGGYAWLAYQGLSRLPRVDLCRRGRHRAATGA